MPGSTLGDVLRFLRYACAPCDACNGTDRELVERFRSYRDDTAFALLVQRHGPMVFGVCRRLLGDYHEAEDAFQATFLVFARRLASIRRVDSLGGWLHGVAQRIAARARAKALERRRRETEVAKMPSARHVDDLTSKELHAVLDEAIGSLPEKYREPVVLIYLEGKTHDEAARQLGCPKTTLTSRLARARELLGRQLERKGFGFAAGALATSLTEMASAARLPVALAIKTVEAATLAAAGKSVAGVLSAHALALAEEGSAMFAIKAKLVVAALALGLAVGGGAVAGYMGSVHQNHAAGDKQQASPSVKVVAAGTDEFGDPLPQGAVARLGDFRFRHEGFGSSNRGLAYTSDGKTLIGFTHSGVIFWDAATGKERKRIRLDSTHVDPGCVAVSADGAILAVSPSREEDPDSPGPGLVLFDLRTGKKIAMEEFDSLSVGQMHFTPDGKRLVMSGGGGKNDVSILDVSSRTLKHFSAARGFAYLHHAISGANRTLAVAVFNEEDFSQAHSIELRDMTSWKLLRVIHDLPRDTAQNFHVFALALSPDGKKLAFASGSYIVLYDTATGERLRELSNGAWTPTLAFTSDSTRLISCSGCPVTFQAGGYKAFVWDVASGKLLDTFDAGLSLYGSMALAPDGRTIALGAGATVRFWDLATRKELPVHRGSHRGSVTAVAYSAHRKMLVSTDKFGSALLWDSRNWKLESALRVAPTIFRSPSLSADGKRLAVLDYGAVDTAVKIWDLHQGNEARAIEIPGNGQIESVVLSPNGSKLFTLGFEPRHEAHFIRQWEVATGMQEKARMVPLSVGLPKRFGQPSDTRHFATLAPDGTTVFAWAHNAGLEMVDTETKRSRLFAGTKKDESDSYYPVRSPDGRMLAWWAGTSQIGLWETITGKQVVLLKGHREKVGWRENFEAAIAWSPDGRLLASGDGRKWPWQPSAAQTVRVWDSATGKELACFGGLNADVSSLTFLGNGNSLAAGLRNGTILILDVSKTDLRRSPPPKLTTQDLESRWSDLVDPDASRAHRAIGTLVAAGGQTVPFLRDRLKPAEFTNQRQVQQWIADLNSNIFTVRRTAGKELEKMGWQIRPLIEKALKANPPLETQRRLEHVLNTLSDNPVPETLRTVRAITILERIGSPQAKAVLESLARGAPGACETEEAKASVERLKCRE